MEDCHEHQYGTAAVHSGHAQALCPVYEGSRRAVRAAGNGYGYCRFSEVQPGHGHRQ